MQFNVFEIIALVAGVIALILNIAAMAVQHWLGGFGLYKVCSIYGCIQYADRK